MSKKALPIFPVHPDGDKSKCPTYQIGETLIYWGGLRNIVKAVGEYPAIDYLTLRDGRVIGVGDESIVLYASEATFLKGDPVILGSINLYDTDREFLGHAIPWTHPKLDQCPECKISWEEPSNHGYSSMDDVGVQTLVCRCGFIHKHYLPQNDEEWDSLPPLITDDPVRDTPTDPDDDEYQKDRKALLQKMEDLQDYMWSKDYNRGSTYEELYDILEQDIDACKRDIKEQAIQEQVEVEVEEENLRQFSVVWGSGYPERRDGTCTREEVYMNEIHCGSDKIGAIDDKDIIIGCLRLEVGETYQFADLSGPISFTRIK